ncbi:MAG: MarR family transcriptional regulator [Eubacteriales bacterium]
MESERYVRFTVLVAGLFKHLQKLKNDNATSFGLKNVHILWVYLLYNHPQGLSANEIAEKGDVDKSLVSREIAELERKGLIVCQSPEGAFAQKRRYGEKFCLTAAGRAVAERVRQKALWVQQLADTGISSEKLAVFYETLEQLSLNFKKIANSRESELLVD